MMRRLTLLPIAVFLLLSCATVYAANEAECDALGANCVCSEPLNTPTWTLTQAGITWSFNPADTSSTDKECQDNGLPGAAYSAASMDLIVDTAATNPTMFAALPAGATVTYVPRSAEGAGSGPFGTRFKTGTDPAARRGMRFYRYYSPNFRFTDQVAPNCNSAKVAQLGWNGDYSGGPMFVATSGWLMYDVGTFTRYNVDTACCGVPDMYGRVGTPPDVNTMRGHWIRFEVYMINDTTSGTSSFEWYMKDITAGTPEVTLINSAGLAMLVGVHPVDVMIDFSVNAFRSNNGDPCDGYFAHSHFLAAAWSTDAGQRIVAATEVEGSGAQTYSGSLSGVFRMQGVGVWR